MDFTYILLVIIVFIMGLGFVVIGAREIIKKESTTKRGTKITGIAAQIFGLSKIILGAMFIRMSILAATI